MTPKFLWNQSFEIFAVFSMSANLIPPKMIPSKMVRRQTPMRNEKRLSEVPRISVHLVVAGPFVMEVIYSSTQCAVLNGQTVPDTRVFQIRLVLLYSHCFYQSKRHIANPQIQVRPAKRFFQVGNCGPAPITHQLPSILYTKSSEHDVEPLGNNHPFDWERYFIKSCLY